MLWTVVITGLALGAVFFIFNFFVFMKWLSIEKIYWSNGLVLFLYQIIFSASILLYLYVDDKLRFYMKIKGHPFEEEVYKALVFGGLIVTLITILVHNIRMKKRFNLHR